MIYLHYITLHYKLFIVAKVKKLQGPLGCKSHNNVRIWLPK